MVTDMDSFDNAGFGDEDLFGDSGFDGSSGQQDDTFGNDLFGDDNSSNSNSMDFDSGSTGQGFNSTEQADFSGSFDSSNAGNFPEEDSGSSGTKKQAIIFIAIAVVLTLIVLIVATKITGSSKGSTSTTTDTVSTTSNRQSTNVDGLMSSNTTSKTNEKQTNNNSDSVNYVKDENEYNWIAITDSEDIQFKSEYTDLTFTVTSIKHYARSVDTNNNLVVKTTLSGSISGLAGTYTLDVPYSKGVKLVVGDSFTVHVQLGTYNGKTVVGEISY
jgi:hypothetical protein